MAPRESAPFRGGRAETFGDRCRRGRFRQVSALREPGTNPKRHGRFPLRALFARVHDVVSFDGRAATGRAAGPTAVPPAKTAVVAEKIDADAEKGQAFAGPDVGGKSGGTAARSRSRSTGSSRTACIRWNGERQWPAGSEFLRSHPPASRGAGVFQSKRSRSQRCSWPSRRSRLWSCRDTFGMDALFARKNRSESPLVSLKLPHP